MVNLMKETSTKASSLNETKLELQRTLRKPLCIWRGRIAGEAGKPAWIQGEGGPKRLESRFSGPEATFEEAKLSFPLKNSEGDMKAPKNLSREAKKIWLELQSEY
jgi:hypothetical protein